MALSENAISSVYNLITSSSLNINVPLNTFQMFPEGLILFSIQNYTN
jgi:hypothetical protein